MPDRPDKPSSSQPIKRGFSLTSTAAHRQSSGNPTALRALTAIGRRAAIVRQKAVDLHHKFEDRWTAKEAIRLWQLYLKESAQHPVPNGAVRKVSPEELIKVASRNVRARTTRRLAKIEDIKTRMGNAVARNLGSPSLTKSFGEAAPAEPRLRAKQPKQRMRP